MTLMLPPSTAAVTDEVAVTTAAPVTGEVIISTAAGEAPGRDKDDSDATTPVATETAAGTTTIDAPVEPTTAITTPQPVSTAAVTDEIVATTAAPVTGEVTITTAAGEAPGRDKDDSDATTLVATETAAGTTTIDAPVEPTTIMTSPQPVSTPAETDEVAVTTAAPVTGEVTITTAAGEAPGRDKDDSDATTPVATETAAVTTTIDAPVEPTTPTSPLPVSTAAVTDEVVATTVETTASETTLSPIV
ncbi:P-selectin glycoprotein ligand 1 precursor, putative [Perkinsus marinus ATCC 50983]|uniref:p-selectin glycoprotein ligand 1, putative n=1 Tax=Perkinsus marinus (strain ATCC 50983 / TXsc) TaxID=423536 RepID=C5LXF7_PERM5|nr:P-selectin glycoprotein ligand 1 precursor, putative [Perkinsus marinus ATCC 50983]EEQ98585.1 P-selectin glycoprotein ligand 1 precursor, putative [Perkinsus marinus ATCC 50983]|eukprot:XP_002765868.1 P-selectin glycoprotein ligand 1 precursor, putative [Perkinsus marinus ATCC 50983]